MSALPISEAAPARLETAGAEVRPARREGRRVPGVAALALVALPLAAHLAFSEIGFNPTDEGFVQAASRRLLDGQVPHRDFISIRPVGSALLHAPELLLGGEAVFWIGRLVAWLELGAIAACWVALGRRLLAGGAALAPGAAALATVAAFVFGAGPFPVMPWHTIDALALASAGLLLAASGSSRRRALGYALLGAAALCRQNFLPAGPLAALVLGERERLRMAIAWAAPLAAAALALAAAGALPDALLQLGAQRGLLETGVRPYATSPQLAMGAAIGLAAGLARRYAARRAAAAAAARLAGPLVLLAAAWAMMRPDGSYAAGAAFLLLGASLGLAAAAGEGGTFRHGLLAAAVGWCASISIGLNTPGFACGALAAHLVLAGATTPAPLPAPGGRRRAAAGAALIALALVAAWSHARLERPYRDRPARELGAPLGGALAGGARLRTNPRTRALLEDLAEAAARAGPGPCAVVADFACHWVRSPRPNPLSIDWPQGTELAHPALRARVAADLERLRGRGAILVQKRHTALAARALFPTAASGDYYLVDHVRRRFRKHDETAHFDIYR